MKYRKQTRKSTIETLEPRLLLSAINEIEPNDRTPQQFSFPEDGIVNLIGTATGRKDKDFFAFTPTVSGPLVINVASQGGAVKLELEEARSSSDLFETEPNDGVNGGTVNVQAGKTYRIRLRSDSKSGNPTYDVTLQFNGSNGGGGGGGGGTGNATVIQEVESNNKQAQANLFAFPAEGEIQLQGTSTSKRDSDFFKFTAAQSGTIAVSVQATGADVQLEVETAASVDVFETEPNDGINSGSFQVQQGVTYFVRLRSRSDASGAYLADLVFTAPLST